jgi:hypothetical protein
MELRRTLICIAVLIALGGGSALASSGEFTIQETVSNGESIHSFKRAAKLLDGQLAGTSLADSTDTFIDFARHTSFGGTIPISTDPNPRFTADITSEVEIPTAGVYSFGMSAGGHAKLTIDGKTFRIHGGSQFTKIKPIKFSEAGEFALSVTYFGSARNSALSIVASAGRFHSLHAKGADFQLVGDAANGGLALGGVASSPGVGGAPIVVGDSQTISAGIDSTHTGQLTAASVVLDGGSIYSWKINSVAGTPGSSTGWDEIAANSLSVDSASSSNPVTVALQSLNGTAPGTPAGVTPGSGPFTLTIAHSDSQVSINGTPQSPEDLLATGNFQLDTSGFTVNNASASQSDFQLMLVSDGTGGDNIQLIFNATPEPGTAVLVGACCAPILLARRRAA